MRILVSLSESIPPYIKDSLVANRKFWRDLPARLSKLPELKKGIHVGIMPSVTVHDNAVAYSKKNNLRLYIGYLIWREDNKAPWNIEVHSFCVDANERVIEPTAITNWPDARYVGIPVNPSDIQGMRYLNRFERMEYITKAVSDVKAGVV